MYYPHLGQGRPHVALHHTTMATHHFVTCHFMLVEKTFLLPALPNRPLLSYLLHLAMVHHQLGLAGFHRLQPPHHVLLPRNSRDQTALVTNHETMIPQLLRPPMSLLLLPPLLLLFLLLLNPLPVIAADPTLSTGLA